MVYIFMCTLFTIYFLQFAAKQIQNYFFKSVQVSSANAHLICSDQIYARAYSTFFFKYLQTGVKDILIVELACYAFR